MNIPNINNTANAGDGVGKNREISGREMTERTGGAEETLTTSPETETVDQAAASPVRDEYRVSKDRELIKELIDEVELSEPPPREELIGKVTRRVRENYYNSSEFMGNLATRLINTGNNS